MRPTKREIELASEVNSLKVQIEFIKGQASDIREAYAKVAKEALALAEEYKKENEKMKRTLSPIKRGKWDGYICSECHVCADYFISGDFYFDEDPNFCPNCGARMDGDVK